MAVASATGGGRLREAANSHRQNGWGLPGAWVVGGVAAMLAALVAGVAFGPAGLPVDRVAGVLLDRLPLLDVDSGLTATETAIVTQVRLPRAVLASMVGALLASAGAAYQGVFRNPLADPYLLGAASGAGLGATIAIVAAGGASIVGPIGAIPLAAFVGAIGAVALAYALGAGRTSTLILAGVAVGALCSAGQTFLLQRDDEAVRDVYAWLLGRLNVAGWDEVALLLPYAVVTMVVLVLAAGRLDVLAVGDDEATALGARPGRTRLVVVGAATLGTAAAVAVSGLIGFVGIIVPHAVRLRAGPGYRRIIPLSALLGAAFLCLADLVARTLLAPAEIPLGVITAAVGAPTFLWLLRRGRPA